MKLIRISAVWCTSCILTYSSWQEIQQKYPNYTYEEYDYDMDNEQVQSYRIGNILPVIIVMNGSREITRIIGEKTTKEIEQVLNEKIGGK